MMVPRWLQDLSRADFLKSVGLYVSRDGLFLVRMRKDFFRLSVIAAEAREITLKGDGDSRRQALTQAIRSLLPHFNPARDPVYVCLSLDQAIGCEVFLPQVAQENLQQVLGYEIERLLPFRRDEVYYDFLPRGKRGDKIGLLLFTVPKRVLDEILDALSAFGVRPRGVETTATALSNYLLYCTGGITGPTVVFGQQNQAWEMVGLSMMTEGWTHKPEILITDWLPRANWVQGPGRELFHRFLRQSPRFFGWGDIQDFLLSVKGERVKVEDLLALGRERLGENKGLVDPFHIPAVGAALRGLREATFPVNLLPAGGEEYKGRTLYRLNTILTVLLLIGLIVWGVSYPVRDEIRLRQLKREIGKLQPSVESLRREEEELNQQRKQISLLSGVRERKGEILHLLNELSRIVPNSAYLSHLRYRDGTIELRGSAENASNLVPLLERSRLFKNVGFNAPSNRGRDNRETFSLRAEIERPEEKAAKP
ncbi:MAG: PilN domain-containing protein [Candidatus Binatia bacterium]